MQQEFKAVLEQDGDWWIATALDIPRAFWPGRTIEEARENLVDASRELLQVRRELAESEIAGRAGVVRETLSVQMDVRFFVKAQSIPFTIILIMGVLLLFPDIRKSQIHLQRR